MSKADLLEHLASGHTHVCQCWSITRRDGVVFGFTDHDQPLSFDGITFRADSGMAAKALASATGLSVNNTEALGLLQADIITETDIKAGRFDGAEVTNWTVRWDDVEARKINFVGHIGTITRRDGSFEAELRGLTDALNQPTGRSYLRRCSAVLGDRACWVDLSSPVYRAEAAISAFVSETVWRFAIAGYNDGWFTHGRVTVLSGAAEGLTGAIKLDRAVGAARQIALWQPLGLKPAVGDLVRIEAGCDKSAESCRVKFANFLNYQGFPHMPGDDWLVSFPRGDSVNDGGSMNA